MNFALKMMNLALKLMNVALKLMNVVLKMMNFVFKRYAWIPQYRSPVSTKITASWYILKVRMTISLLVALSLAIRRSTIFSWSQSVEIRQLKWSTLTTTVIDAGGDCWAERRGEQPLGRLQVHAQPPSQCDFRGVSEGLACGFADPYTKFMNANDNIDGAASWLMCSVKPASSFEKRWFSIEKWWFSSEMWWQLQVATAQRLGVPKEKWVYQHSVCFLLKNLHFLLKNLHFLLKNVDFLLNNVDFYTKRGRTATRAPSSGT